jgi:hypothetical protein
MTRSKLSSKVMLLVGGIGLSIAAFAGSQPAAAQSYSDEYACPVGTMYDPTYGCTSESTDDFGYYGYPSVVYGQPDHRGFDHGIGHGMGSGFNHGGMGFAHAGGGMAGGFHGGGFGGGHR